MLANPKEKTEMDNYEYAQATTEQLDGWLCAASQRYLEEQEFCYEERIRAWYAANGLWNVY